MRGGTLAPDDPLRGTGTLVALAPDFAACFVMREVGADEWSFAVTYDRDTVVECALPLMARMEPLEAGSARRALGQRRDDLRELPALPRQRRRPRLLETQLGAGDLARVALADRVRVAGVGLVAARPPRRGQRELAQLVPVLERARARHRPQRVGDRLGVLVRGQALAQHLGRPSRASARGRRVAVGGDEALDAAVAQAVRQRVPALEVAVLALGRVRPA